MFYHLPSLSFIIIIIIIIIIILLLMEALNSRHVFILNVHLKGRALLTIELWVGCNNTRDNFGNECGWF